MDNKILSEFCVPASEIDSDLEIGDLGKLVISVEVIGKVGDHYYFRKHHKAIPEGNFRKETVSEMRDRLVKKQETEEDAEDEY